MNRAAMLLSLGLSAATSAFLTYNPALVEPIVYDDFDHVTISPHGSCVDDGGVRDCYRTSAVVHPRPTVQGMSIVVPPHDSETRPETIPVINGLIDIVVLPNFKSRNASLLAARLDGNPIYPEPTRAHVQWAGVFHRKYAALVVLPPLVDGAPTITDTVTGDAPDVVMVPDGQGGTVAMPVYPAIVSMVETFVIPAVREQTGLR